MIELKVRQREVIIRKEEFETELNDEEKSRLLHKDYRSLCIHPRNQRLFEQ